MDELTKEELGSIVEYLISRLDEDTRNELVPNKCRIHVIYDPLCRECNGIILTKLPDNN